MDSRRVNFGLRAIIVVLVVWSTPGTRCESLDEKMRADPEISQFYSYLQQCKVCNNTLESEEMTVFAPINAAFQHILKQNPDTNAMVLYHIINVPKKTDQLSGSYTYISSRLSGSPPLWITHSSSRYHNDIYINNARLLLKQSNVIGKKGPLVQIMHKIDEVLIPTRSSLAAANSIYNPNAWEFLENYESLIQGSHRVRNFRQRVQQTNKQDIFKTEGSYTFFVPVDEGFANSRAVLIDDKIIDGHVIPKQVLFTTPTAKDTAFPTLANGDNNIRVLISFTQEQRENLIINYVKSYTALTDGTHPQGAVLAEIVKANIPVKNGVIHLIQKPLMVVDSTIKELLQEHMDYICRVGNVRRMENVVKEVPQYPLPIADTYSNYYDYDEKDGGILNKFVNAIKNLEGAGDDILRTIEKSQDVTLFAPCNAALEGHLVMDNIFRNKEKFLEILKLHLVVDNRLYVDTVMKRNQNKIYQARTLAKGKNVYFNVVTHGNNRTMTIEGGGVNATVIQPDLAAKNGIIHIIDKVLGVPYTTVLDKLRTDPMLRDTYSLGNLEGFNNQLGDINKKFTYFVPRDKAWSDARVVMPSAIKVLFMRDYAYHATNTLQRHLVVSDEPYTMERIKQLSMVNESMPNYGTGNHFVRPPPNVELPTLRGSLKLYVEERQDNSYVIHWNEMKIPVFRPNVECINGIIHVIDVPFLKKDDIRVSTASNKKPSIFGSILAMILVITYAIQ
ncbi:fasciclin 1 Fas1 domain-containing isoform X2 [Rhynchophorus ferrugineus]|uniref:fasciclin 1 Fas1 domain-containing isoform X2 n=1 Tax=Rhynchophorus ferrugineus TaxID=354439 RepID=UPI003FCE8000